jgi:RNA polymerase sigma-70 factor (ECF subfamily)
MSDEGFHRLLSRIRQGDHEAFAEMVAAYQPQLRTAIHRSLPDRIRRRFDSLDVVQSVWACVLPGLRAGAWQFADESRLAAFLMRVARRRLINRLRRHDPAARREQQTEADVDSLPARWQDRPSQAAQAGELWERMLAVCPPEHHELLRLRRQGLSREEIARQVGLHEGSVRRVLRQLARQLALEDEPLAVAGTEPEGP